MQNDPIGFAAGDQNLYRTESNSPINRLDPLGLDDITGVGSAIRQDNWDKIEKCKQMRGLGKWDAEEFWKLGPMQGISRQLFVKGCVGLCMGCLRTGRTIPTHVPGTRCFRTREAAEAYKRLIEMQSGGSSTLFAVQSERGGEIAVNGSTTEIDPVSIDLTGHYNFLTWLIGPDGQGYWEWMNTNLGSSRKPAFVSHETSLSNTGWHEYFCVTPLTVTQAEAK